METDLFIFLLLLNLLEGRAHWRPLCPLLPCGRRICNPVIWQIRREASLVGASRLEGCAFDSSSDLPAVRVGFLSHSDSSKLATWEPSDWLSVPVPPASALRQQA